MIYYPRLIYLNRVLNEMINKTEDFIIYEELLNILEVLTKRPNFNKILGDKKVV